MWAASPEKLPRDTLIACSKEPQNDTGNGQRLLKWFGPDLLYVRDVGWHIWTGTHWNHEGGDQIVTMLAQGTAARIALEADVMPPSLSEKQMIEAAEHAHPTLEALEKERGADAKKDSRWASLVRIVAAGEQAAVALAGRKENRRKYSISSGNTGKIRGMLEQALPHRTVTVDELDSEPLAFNVENGTLRFVYDEVADPDASDYSEQMIKCYRVELYPHKRGDNISKVAPVVFDPNARCPTFDNAVARFLPLGSVREFVQRYQGYALTGLTGEQCFVFNYGTGSNWKSTFIEIVSRIMGPYCATIAFESLAGDQQRSGSQATPDLARLPGARLVRASEPERGVQFREALIKSLTGGEPMLVRSLNKEFFEFRPTFKLVLSGNHKPEISGVDHGIWRRVNFVPWPVTISSQEKRPMDEVMKELWAERSGILNWLVEGTLAYLNEGLQTPQEVIDATADYREEMDPVGTFVAQCIVTEGPPADGSEPTYVFARKLYDAFAAWAVANAVRPWREKSFAVAMSQKGFVKEKHRTGMRYLNILLHDVPEPSRRRSDIPAHPDDSDVVPA
jgi:putative DNA primase/helicase